MLAHVNRALVNTQIAELALALKERLQWLIAMETVPYTQNKHYFSSYRDKFLARYKAKRSVCEETLYYSTLRAYMILKPTLTLDEKAHLKDALASMRNAGCTISSITELQQFRADKNEMYEEELTVAAEVRAYFQVAYKVRSL